VEDDAQGDEDEHLDAHERVDAARKRPGDVEHLDAGSRAATRRAVPGVIEPDALRDRLPIPRLPVLIHWGNAASGPRRRPLLFAEWTAE
jgi:hypothetical protein